jgi:hypothetical protein
MTDTQTEIDVQEMSGEEQKEAERIAAVGGAE